MSDLTERLRRTYQQLDSDSGPFRTACDDVEKYIMPRVGHDSMRSDRDEATAKWKDPDVWDATAPVGLTKLAAHVHTSATPPGLRFAVYDFEDTDLTENPVSKEWIEKNTDVVFKSIEASDFNGEMSSGYQEFVGLGNMVVVQEVNDEGEFDYTAVPVGEVEFEESAKGQMRTFFRKLRWTPGQMVDKFGTEGVPQGVRDLEKSKSQAKQDVIFAIFERAEILKKWTPSLNGRPRLAVPAKRPYGFVYFLLQTGEMLGEEGGYYDFPAFIARWERTPGSRWGQGLGHVALPMVKGLNAFVELVLTQHALAVDPPSVVSERGLLSDLDRQPGGMTVVENIEESVRALDEGTKRYDVAAMSLEEQRAEVRRLFREDQLELKDSPQMTATEAQIRYDIMLKLLGPTFARLTSEFLSPMLHTAYRALYRAGKFPPAPPVVKQKKAEISIKYQSPMARARRTDEVASLERGAAFVAGLLKMGFRRGPMAFDDEQAVRDVFNLLDISVGTLRPKEKVEAMAKEQAQAEARQVNAEAMAKEAQAVAAVGGAPPAGEAFPYGSQPALTPGGQVA